MHDSKMHQKPNYYLISAHINGRKHNLAHERTFSNSTYSWSPVQDHLGQGSGAEIFTTPTAAREMFRRVMRHIVHKEAPFFRSGLDADSLYLEGVYIQHRNLDPEHLETEDERKDRLLALLSSGASISADDAGFLRKLLG
ncbi:MAG: hypothetical protein AB1717_00530 [Pseudomonadota bacterium]